MKKIPQDILGEIAVLKFPREIKTKSQKIKLAKQFLKEHNSVTTILEKTNKIKGRLRKPTTTFLVGKNTKETTYNENNCKFKFNIDETYFSPRLASHRKDVCEEVVKKISRAKSQRVTNSSATGGLGGHSHTKKILIMFAGVAPWPIILGKILKQENKQAQIFSNEINRKANKYAKENIKLNKLENYIQLIPGDAKKIPQKLKEKQKFDLILMPRPNLKTTFLKTALKLSKKGTIIYYHGFAQKKEEIINEIKKDTKNKIGKISIQKAGEIAPYTFRWLAKFKVN